MKTLKTQKELKVLVKKNRKNIKNINGVEFSELYPILRATNKHTTYYDVDSQENKFLFAPFTVILK